MLIKRPNKSHTLLTPYLLLAPISVNSADPDAAFDQCLHCFPRQKRSSVKEYIFFSKKNLWPLNIYTYWPSFIVSNSANISYF